MLIGSIPMVGIVRPWRFEVHVDLTLLLAMAGIIVIGTVVAYTLFIYSLKGIGPERASLTSCVEPVSATLFSILWLKTAFHWIDLIGFACILGAIIILTDFKSIKKSRSESHV